MRSRVVGSESRHSRVRLTPLLDYLPRLKSPKVLHNDLSIFFTKPDELTFVQMTKPTKANDRLSKVMLNPTQRLVFFLKLETDD